MIGFVQQYMLLIVMVQRLQKVLHQTTLHLAAPIQVQGRSSIVSNSASAEDAQQAFKRAFNVLINEDCSIGVDIAGYQNVLEHAMSKLDFSIDIGIDMLSSNFNLN